MNYGEILRRLVQIECAVGVLDTLTVRKLVMETQEYVLLSEKVSLENHRLKNVQISHAALSM